MNPPPEISFSVVIPTLCRPSLPATVRSVLDQSRPPRQVIVVGNGPLGSDAAVILRDAGVESDLVTVHSLPPFSGPATPRNVGAWRADSLYVAFLDDDDRFAPDYLEVMADRLRQDPVDLLVGTRVFLDAAGAESRRTAPESTPPDRWLERLLSGANPGVGGQNLVVKRSAFFDTGGFPVALTSGQDRYFVIKALRSGLTMQPVADAEVLLNDPVGFRATGRTSNFFNDVRILTDNWDAMTWGARYRHGRMVLSRLRRKLLRDRRVRRRAAHVGP